MEIFMKRAIIVLGLALVSSSFVSNATTTVPKSRLVFDDDVISQADGTQSLQDIDLKESFAPINDPRNRRSAAGLLDMAEDNLTFSALEGLSTPLDVPVGSGMGLLTAHISSGANSSAQVVDASFECSADCQEPHAVLMGVGDLQITFPRDVNHASLHYCTSDCETRLDPGRAMSIVLLDATGNLVGSQVIADMGEDRTSIDIASDIPFRSMALTTNADVWFISDISYELSSFEQKPAAVFKEPQQSTTRPESDTGPQSVTLNIDEQGLSSGTTTSSEENGKNLDDSLSIRQPKIPLQRIRSVCMNDGICKPVNNNFDQEYPM
jgi:hypothetical protein